MQPEKVVQLIERLTAKTNSGELRWSEGVRIDTYQISFPDYSIIIEENTSLRATDPVSSFMQDKSSHRKEFSMRILDSRGDVVASILDDRSAGIMSSALGKMVV